MFTGGDTMRLLLWIVYVTGTMSLEWRAPSPPPGGSVRGCLGRDVTMAWDYALNVNERLIDVEFLFTGIGQAERTLASLIRNNFLVDPNYSGRLTSELPTGLRLAGMTSTDLGVYVIRVNVVQANAVVAHSRNVTLEVGDQPVLSQGQLGAILMPTPQKDSSSGQWHTAITCGPVTNPGTPPVNVVIVSPDNRTTSARFESATNTYVGLLPNPVTSGQYACQFDRQNVCLPPDSPLLTPAYITVDGTKEQLAVAQEELKELRGELRSHLCVEGLQPPVDCTVARQCDTRTEVHNLHVNGLRFNAYCDQTTDGGGWTVIVNRQDGSVDFSRNWQLYEDGFGNKTGEYWLGLRYIHALTNGSRQYELRVDIGDWNGSTAYATYDSFRVDGPDTNYALRVSGYRGTAGDSLTLAGGGDANNMAFSTMDRDNDRWGVGSCANQNRMGWWMNACFRASPTGIYHPRELAARPMLGGVRWVAWRGDGRSYRRMQLKIRPRPATP